LLSFYCYWPNVEGVSPSPPPTPTSPPPTPPTPPSPPTPPPSGEGKFKAANDVLQVYANDPRIPIWVLGHGNWTERAGSGNVSGTGNNAVVTLSGQVRYGVKCKRGAGDGIEDLGLALQRGYQDSPDDYKSIEQTGFVEITQLASSDSDQDITWFGPSGRHTGGGPSNKGCMGSCYKGSIHAKTGKNRQAFENWHVKYAYIPWRDALNEVVKQTTAGKRVGFKWVKMIVGSGANAYARCEIWLQTKAIGYDEAPTNEWQLVRVMEDKNNWPGSSGMSDCKCKINNQAMVWGAPSVVYRWDNQTGKLSLGTIQEIKVPTTLYKEGDIVKA
jgi:hypothetical protein